jgi:hypothetical protein
MEFVMSRTTKKATIKTTDRTLHVVADTDSTADGKQTTVAETKLWAALQDNPGTTTAKLAMAAGVGRSTAAKILVRWATDNTVNRTEGEGQRAPDTWTMPDTDTDTDTKDVAMADDAGAADDVPVSEVSETSDARPMPDPDDGGDITEDVAVPAPQRDEEGQDDPATVQDAVTDEVSAPKAGPVSTDVPVVLPATNEFPAAASPPETKERLAKGALRGMVEDYLADHPGDSFGPAKIGKDLGKSGGAVNNALEKLVADGYALKTCEAPKRFAYNGTADAK